MMTIKNHNSMVIKGSLGHFCSSGRHMQEIALARRTSTNVLVKNKVVLKILRAPAMYTFPYKFKDVFIASGPKT